MNLECLKELLYTHWENIQLQKTFLKNCIMIQMQLLNRAGLINNLSITYERLGQKNKYIQYMLDAFHETDEESEYTLRMTILRNLYYYYLDLRDHKTALSYLERARNIAMAENDEQQIAALNAIMGTYYWKIDNDLKKGLNQFRMATSIFNPEINLMTF